MSTPYYQDYLAYKKECEKLQLLLKMRDGEVKKLGEVITEQKKDVDIFKENVREALRSAETWKRKYDELSENVKEVTEAARSWMKDYDDLKNKYEPEVIIASDSSVPIIPACPKCGTTELLCGYGGPGCTSENNL